MQLERLSQTLLVLGTVSLLSGCLNTDLFKQQDRSNNRITQLTIKNEHLEDKLRSLTQNSSELMNDNAQLKADNAQLKQRLMGAVQVLDKFRKRIIADLNRLPDESGLLEAVGNQIVERPGVLPIASRRKPVLLVNTKDRLAPFFVVRRFAGYFKAPTQVQLWLLNYQPGSDTYQVSYRSKTFEVFGNKEQDFEIEQWQAASSSGSVYGFYFPYGNAAVAYHPTSNEADGAYLSKNKKLNSLAIGQSIGLESSRDLQGVKISWAVSGLRQ